PRLRRPWGQPSRPLRTDRDRPTGTRPPSRTPIRKPTVTATNALRSLLPSGKRPNGRVRRLGSTTEGEVNDKRGDPRGQHRGSQLQLVVVELRGNDCGRDRRGCRVVRRSVDGDVEFARASGRGTARGDHCRHDEFG